jgi:hypothetical protein
VSAVENDQQRVGVGGKEQKNPTASIQSADASGITFFFAMSKINAPTVRFAARDPGAANVLTSFLQRWEPGPAITVDHWTLPRAAAVFGRADIPCREFPDDFARRELECAWRDHPADALITGTSHYRPFEPALWDIARRHNCPTLAIIDYWSNLERRFQVARPDAVGAIDDRQADEVIALGFSSDQVIVVGHAWLFSLREQLNSAPVDFNESAEEGSEVRVLYVSEPISYDVAIGANPPYGFDEVDSFRLLHQAACEAVRAGNAVNLAVKFHPYENPAEFKKRISDLPPLSGLTLRFLDHHDAPHTWVRWSDLVVGISSVLLLESMVLGKPVISVQPGLRRENTFAASRLGFAGTLTDAAKAQRALTALLLSADRRDVLRAGHRPFLQAISKDPISPIANWIKNSLNH